MSKVVAIHNTVNERAWQHILAWEALHACECAHPRLKRFQGKPNEFSPKARLLNFLVRPVAVAVAAGRAVAASTGKLSNLTDWEAGSKMQQTSPQCRPSQAAAQTAR